MNDGDKFNYGLKINTKSLTNKDIQLLNEILLNKYNLNSSLLKENDKINIYFPKASMLHLSNIIKSYMISSMYYKLNGF